MLTAAPSGFLGQLLTPAAPTGALAPGAGTRKPWRVLGCCAWAVRRCDVRWWPRVAHGPLLLHSHIHQDDREDLLGSGDAVRVSHGCLCVCRPQCPVCASSSLSHPDTSLSWYESAVVT